MLITHVSRETSLLAHNILTLSYIFLQAFLVGKREPANIEYSYILPIDGKQNYSWVIDREWSTCSQECQGELLLLFQLLLLSLFVNFEKSNFHSSIKGLELFYCTSFLYRNLNFQLENDFLLYGLKYLVLFDGFGPIESRISSNKYLIDSCTPPHTYI